MFIANGWFFYGNITDDSHSNKMAFQKSRSYQRAKILHERIEIRIPFQQLTVSSRRATLCFKVSILCTLVSSVCGESSWAASVESVVSAQVCIILERSIAEKNVSDSRSESRGEIHWTCNKR